ncbi:MAG: DnaJ C-terminal domain-containing protein [Acidimicrobiales bacterium]|jgi:molecular chaperone DnaJ|nr:DnaJ C-terminal domain-containing protein [Acidimicrobiales bacterium]MDP6900773.1 DnaJ C-terminal domain-containing protein [Acidimicrobiales bacterium]HJL99470.1 DnaJ C-terminal domain-containing protein [Acidimicrobiales bacterium]
MAAQREWFEKDYYAVLGVSSTASSKEITKAYRKLARSHHPDAKGGNEERFKEVSAAYDVLGDDTKREDYDEARRIGPSAAGGFASGADGFNVHFDDLDDLSGMFGNLFGRGQRGPVSMRGVDQETRIHLGFRDAIDGVTTNVLLGGAVDGERRQVKVRIPAGVDNGQRIRLSGKGGAGRNGGPNGDLYVVVEVAPDSMFGRKGKHLTLVIPVTFPEAALGAEIKIPTYDHSTVTLKIPPGTKSGTTFRVKGRGVLTAKSTGDLLVTLEIAVPAELSPKEREAIEALSEVTDWSPRNEPQEEG